MSVVGLTLSSDDDIYVNPNLVTSLIKAPAPDAETCTVVIFSKDHQIVVKGDIDYVAFHLFPNGVR